MDVEYSNMKNMIPHQKEIRKWRLDTCMSKATTRVWAGIDLLSISGDMVNLAYIGAKKFEF